MQVKMAESAEQTETLEVPDKLYFRIGEVSRLAGVKPYVLRYWETEFSFISPKKSGTGHRLYRRKDVESILEVKRLLYDKRFTIEGARKTFAGKIRNPPSTPPPQGQGELFRASALYELRQGLEGILKLLR